MVSVFQIFQNSDVLELKVNISLLIAAAVVVLSVIVHVYCKRSNDNKIRNKMSDNKEQLLKDIKEQTKKIKEKES